MNVRELESSRRAAATPTLVPGSLNFMRFAIVTVIGALGGLIVPSLGSLRQPLLLIVFLGLVAKLFLSIVRRQFTFALGVAAFMCAIEPALRVHIPELPFLSLAYLLLGCSVLMFAVMRPRKDALAQPAIAYGIYAALEVAGSMYAESFAEARSILVPSILMFAFMVTARRVRLTPTGTTFVLASYVAGAVTLTGFALRSYLAGNIVWGTESNFEAAGNMPPNHISLLLSVAVFACILLSENANKIQRIAFLSISTIVGLFMVLTFSRGGTVILLGGLLVYYVVLRRTSRRTIFILIAATLIGMLISYGTKEITSGKIADRYGDTQTSNRLTIVMLGWGIYFDNPVLGVGTSNFSEAIKETEFDRVTGAHNELVRSAAEHGTPGLLAWLWFITSSFIGALRSGDALRSRRGLRVVLLGFALFSMFYNGLKLTVQPMLVLLALSAFTAADAPPKSAPRKRDALR